MEINSKRILAENLSRLMLDNKLNQVDLAKRSMRFGKGVNQKTISNYLDRSDDSVANPCLKKIDVLARCFGLKPCQLISHDLFKATKDQPAEINLDRLEESIKEGALLLFEAGIVDKEKAALMSDLAKDVSRSAGIIYNSQNENNSKVVFDFVAYLNARKASGLS